MPEKPVLAGLRLEELKKTLVAYPPLRSRQIHEWICRGIKSFEEMSNLPLSLRKELSEKYMVFAGEVSSELKENDGTIKIGITLPDGAVIEAVMLKDGKDRKTACLSSQAGCASACVFCKTGMLGLKRNLLAEEISTQFLHLKKLDNGISHIVIMGMGEPLLNMDELKRALDFLMESRGINISKRRITISTSGIASGIIDMAHNGPDVRLALSLTTAREGLRRQLMPASESLPRLKEALLEYQQKRERRITLEMVLLGGLNTSALDAKAAADFAKDLSVVFNLIPWNPVPGMEFEGLPLKPPSPEEVSAFLKALESRGLKVTRRTAKGRGISGACGQLGVIQVT